MKKLIPTLFALFLFGSGVHSQILNRTIGNYSSELAKNEIKAKSRFTKITFYSNNGLLVIEDNLAGLQYNDIKTDTIKNQDKIIPLKFQTNITGNLNQIFKENKYSNLIRIEGNLTINGISKECIAYYAPIIINASTGEVLLDFDIKFDLKDFNLNDSTLLFKDLTELEIEDGFVLKIE